jgi:redox-sensitive bicupin YhaK (pirin superfamily)
LFSDYESIRSIYILNHHGRQEYLPGTAGLPFGLILKRGIETITFILEGELMHEDSTGAASVKGRRCAMDDSRK